MVRHYAVSPAFNKDCKTITVYIKYAKKILIRLHSLSHRNIALWNKYFATQGESVSTGKQNESEVRKECIVVHRFSRRCTDSFIREQGALHFTRSL